VNQKSGRTTDINTPRSTDDTDQTPSTYSVTSLVQAETP